MARQVSSPNDPQARTVVQVDENYLVGHQDDVVDVTTTGITVRLPEEPLYGEKHTISASGGTVTLNGNGNVIEGSLSLAQGTAVDLVFSALDTWVPAGNTLTSVGSTGTTGSTGSTGSTGQTGAAPAGTGSELQARLNATTMQTAPVSRVSATEIRYNLANGELSVPSQVAPNNVWVWCTTAGFDGGVDALNIGSDPSFSAAKTFDEMYLIVNQVGYWSDLGFTEAFNGVDIRAGVDPAAILGFNVCIGDFSFANAFQSATKTIYMGPGHLPTGNPSSGILLTCDFATSGKLKARNSLGNKVTLVPA